MIEENLLGLEEYSYNILIIARPI